MMQTRTTGLLARKPQAQQGQTIVVALLVLLLLGFIGGLFSSIVTRNLANAARSNRIQTANYYAEAGVRFADDQLTHNPDGADWRPPLQYQITNQAYQPKDGLGSLRYAQTLTQNVLPTPDPNDPDLPFLQQGFARYNIGTGRFLLRLTYDPIGITNGAMGDPRGRYIKIESVGREGSVDPQDPTTFQNKPSIRLASTLVEYKAIGLTDYARFETNPDKRSDIMALGSASEQYVTDFDSTQYTAANPYVLILPPGYPLVTTYGAPDAYTKAGAALVPTSAPNAGSNLATGPDTQPGGGGIHVNGSVRFYGFNYFYLNNTNGNTGSYNETMEVAGNLLIDGYDGTNNTKNVKVIVPTKPPTLVPNAGAALATQDVTPSNTTGTFDTLGGAVRDSGSGTDAADNPRNANRLEPPVLESVNPATSLPRYKDITINSVARSAVTDTNSTPASKAGAYGYGQAIYINNSTDVQSDSSSLIGGYTLIDEWLHRAPPGLGRNSWSASFYQPPGTEIVLGRQSTLDSTGRTISFYGVRLTRSDLDASGKPVLWKDPTGANPIKAVGGPQPDWENDSDLGATMLVPYTEMNASNPTNPTGLAGTALTAYQANPNNDVIIYAEGNIRVRGTVSALANAAGAGAATPTTEDATVTGIDARPRHVTIVTNGTAYIEGSLLRGNPESSISVLAHDYVCVNTTQFLAGAQSDANPIGTRPPGPYSGDPALQALDFTVSDEVLLQEFHYVQASTIVANTASAPALYISGGPGASGDAAADFDLLDTATGGSLLAAPGTFTLFQSPFQQLFTTVGLDTYNRTRTTYPLSIIGAGVTLPVNDLVQLAVRRAPVVLNNGQPLTTATQDFLLERAAILPADIRIEAVLFAQTRSFFVIPGDWFNTNTADNLAAYSIANARPSIDNTNNDQKRYPFFGQPVDMKIIIDGSVSEARPADIAAQTAWMEKWGWIPLYHGTAADPNNVPKPEQANRNSPLNTDATPRFPGVGLTLLYNPQAGYPFAPAATATVNATHYLRTDIYGRPLPYTPKLPVCSGLLYAGQNDTDQPILQ